MKTNAPNDTILVFLVFVVIALSFAAGYEFHKEQNYVDMKHLAWYESQYRTMFGSLDGQDYELYSLDRGKTWYDTTHTDDKKIIINGLVEKVRPGLLKKLAAYEALDKRAAKGPLDPNNPKDMKLLVDIGFSVSRK